MKQIDKEYILNKVGKALDYQFESYSWYDMLEDCGLTLKELMWAKEHINYKAYIIE